MFYYYFILLALALLSLIKATFTISFVSEEQESGLISISKEKGDIFYWLFHPRSHNIEAPLVIWLNGGPGSSSLVGLFYENGPFKLVRSPTNSSQITLERRDISWNEDLYMLYIDQPRGVGFSKLVGEVCRNESCIAEDMYIFIHKFFDLHREFYYTPFYITGESYGGHYIPAIGRKLYDFPDERINLKGLAIGNPWTDPQVQMGMYAYFLRANGVSTLPQYLLDKTRDLACQFLLKLNISSTSFTHRICWTWAAKAPISEYNFNMYDITTSKKYNMSELSPYLNQPEIKQLLGIYDNREFISSSGIIWNVFEDDFLESQSSNVNYLVENGVNILIYVGMNDYIANYMGTEAWIRKMEWSRYSGWADLGDIEWVVDNQIKGYYRKLGNMRYVKILNAGHLVPMNLPTVALNLIMDFLFATATL